MAEYKCGCGATLASAAKAKVKAHEDKSKTHIAWQAAQGPAPVENAPVAQSEPDEDVSDAEQVATEEVLASPTTQLAAGVLCNYPGCNYRPMVTIEEIDDHRASDYHDRFREQIARAHRVTLQEAANTRAEGLDKDLGAIVRDIQESPQERAKALRMAFSNRGWPNATHVGTVRDFILEHQIEIAPDSDRILRKLAKQAADQAKAELLAAKG